FRAATGELVQGGGRLRVTGESEFGQRLGLKGWLAPVRKPLASAGEITDKGYVNQRLTQDCRSELVASLFVEAPPPNVVQF
ncbi:MAG: hypothetical protein VXW22_02835, partial [Pseudomonadota bacterium]|nr:hypothetical protein [Pseudomonadota bacterium]